MNAFDVIAEPTRREILDALLKEERSVGELVDLLGLSQPKVSKHLKVLSEHGFVTQRADAQRRIYAVKRDGFGPIEEWIAPYRLFWKGRFNALETHLNKGRKQ